jgi:hypothetical protein
MEAAGNGRPQDEGTRRKKENWRMREKMLPIPGEFV